MLSNTLAGARWRSTRWSYTAASAGKRRTVREDDRDPRTILSHGEGYPGKARASIPCSWWQKTAAQVGGKQQLWSSERRPQLGEHSGKKKMATPATAHTIITVKPANASVGPRPKTIALRKRSASWLHTGWVSASRSV